MITEAAPSAVEEPSVSVSDEDRFRYAAQMERVKLRIDEAENLLKTWTDERGLIYSAVQLRLAIEEIAFASLVGNRYALEEQQRSVGIKKWDQVCKSLRSLNPDYWPQGVVATRDHEGNMEWEHAEGTLEEDESAGVWGRLSRLLHARNPWEPPLDLKEEQKFQAELVGRLHRTLNEHLIKMMGGDELMCCQVGGSPVRVYVFGAISDSEP